ASRRSWEHMFYTRTHVPVNLSFQDMALTSAHREREPDVSPTRGRVGRMRLAAMGFGDRLHDREAETRSLPAPAGVGAREALERLPEKAGRETFTLVAHVQLDAPVAACRGKVYRSPSVAERVVDQVRERLLEPQPVALDDAR